MNYMNARGTAPSIYMSASPMSTMDHPCAAAGHASAHSVCMLCFTRKVAYLNLGPGVFHARGQISCSNRLLSLDHKSPGLPRLKELEAPEDQLKFVSAERYR